MNSLERSRGILAACSAALFGLSLLFSQSEQVRADKNPKPEDVVERTILAYGGRPGLYTVQRNGTLRALVKFITPQGTNEGKTVTRFIRKEKMKDDLRMIEQEFPGTRYLLGFDGKDLWSIHNGETQEVTKDTAKLFRAAHEHSYEALLRYKENDAKLEYVGSTKLGNLEMDIIDLISAEGVRTRYEISRKSGRILYLNYEERPTPEAEPIKYRLYFKSFRVVQNTLLPEGIQVYQDGKLIEDRKIVEAAFNVQLDEKAFKAENANKPSEAAVKP
ncbi:MAG TPA: hypothetical protein PLQ88_12520 [Blastocatellia bacterium]|nr:hypothetical protein [Blastocatellia bacterium]